MNKATWSALLVAVAVAGCGKSESEPSPEPEPAREPEPEPEPEPDMVAVTWPAGDVDRGKQAFIEHKCFSCHMVLLDDELMELHKKAQGKAGQADHSGMDHGAEMSDKGAGRDKASMDHGAAAHPSGHNKPPPLNAATLGKPPLILVKQMVIPGDLESDHHAHYGTYADRMTLSDVTHLAAYFRKMARTLDDKPDAMPAEDLDLPWPSGDAKAGDALIAQRCNMCHGQGTAKLAPSKRPRLVSVWNIAIAEEHEPMLETLTLRQVSDLVEALTSSP